MSAPVPPIVSEIDRHTLEMLHLQVLGMQAQLSAIEGILARVLGVPGREQVRRAVPDANVDERTTPPRAIADAAQRLLAQTRTPEEQHAATFMHGRGRERVDVPERRVAPDTQGSPSGHGGEEAPGSG